MKIKEITEMIEEFAPLTLAAEWDHCGIRVGTKDRECTGIIVSLDLTDDVIAKAKKEKCNLIVTHHPFLWDKIGSVDLDTIEGKYIEELLKNDITVYSAHTNMDATEGGISYKLAEMFGGRNMKMNDFGYFFEIDKTDLKTLAMCVKEKLLDPTVMYVGKDTKKISKVYVASGSGWDKETYELVKDKADCFITGDVKYHGILEAYEDKFPLIVYSHYYSEIIVEDIFMSVLRNCGVKVIKANEKCPFKKAED